MKILASLFIIGIFTQSIANASVTSKKLQTINEKSFEVEHSIFAKNKPVVLFLAGLGNKGGQINQIRDEFNNAKLNLFTFSRHENPCDSFRTCISNVARRVKTGQIIISNKGAKSSLEDIFENEITTIINYIIQNNAYNKTKGIHLIGSSYGSWLSLTTLNSNFREHIKGIIFLSPVVAPHKSSGKYKNEINKFHEYTKINTNIPVLTIGSQKDEIWPGVTTMDAAKFLHKKISAKSVLIDSNSQKHANKLLLGDHQIRRKIIDWLQDNSK
ncbi:MAG: alpha/beta hydrolase [Rhodospirillales bacterium]